MDLFSGFAGVVLGCAGALATKLLAMPTTRAEARKITAEASHQEWQNLADEIARLDRMTIGLRTEVTRLSSVVDAAGLREVDLERENLELRRMVKRLERRITDLEAIFKIGPVPPDMQAALDKLKDVP